MNSATIATSCPESLKTLVPYFIRARDFAARDPKLAYLCKSYAVQLGIELLPQVSGKPEEAETTKFLMDLMAHLEAEKQELSMGSQEGKELLLKRAYMLFKRADDKERASEVDKAVIQMFSTAGVLMECTKQFGEMDPDVQQKQRYARYTATQIKKALDSGVPYVSPNEPVQETVGQDELEAALGMNATPAPQVPVHQNPAPVPSVPAPAAVPPPVVPGGPPSPGGAPPSVAELDAFIASIPSGPSAPAPYTDTSVPQVDDDDVMKMEERLRKARGDPVAVPAPHVAAPYAPTFPAVPAALPAASPRVEELEEEVTQLKLRLAQAEAQQAAANQQIGQYQQAVTMMKTQLASSGGSATGIVHPIPGFNPTLNDMTDVQKFAKYVISALQFKDVTTARENLVKALSKVNGHG